MRVYKGNRKLDDIISTAKVSGWEVDTEIYDSGGDWIIFIDTHKRLLQVLFDIFSGRFVVYSLTENKVIATHVSNELDSEDWYRELLDMFYEGV